MKTLNEFLLSKTNNKVLEDKYYLIWPMALIYWEIEKTYVDEELTIKGTPDRWWLVSYEQLSHIIKQFDKEELESDLYVYDIPKGYNEDTIKDALKTGEVRRHELIQIDIDKLL